MQWKFNIVYKYFIIRQSVSRKEILLETGRIQINLELAFPYGKAIEVFSITDRSFHVDTYVRLQIKDESMIRRFDFS